MVKNLPADAEDVRNVGSIPGSGRSLEEGMATHSSILAWRIPWTEESGRLQPIRSHRVRHERDNLVCRYPRGRGWEERGDPPHSSVWKTCWAAVVDCLPYWSTGVKDRNHSVSRTQLRWCGTHTCPLATRVHAQSPCGPGLPHILLPNLQPQAHPLPGKT